MIVHLNIMKCKEIIAILESKWPSSYALSWDNVGLLVGSEEKQIDHIFVTLDVTDDTLKQAVDSGADMIISHHPLLFSAIKQITDRNFTGRRVISLIQHDICCYAMHTNFDVKGMAKLSSESLNLQNDAVLEVTAEETVPQGIGRVGMLAKEQTLQQFATFVKAQLKVPQVQIYGDPDRVVRRAAISSGSGKSMIKHAVLAGADVLVTGDIDHHNGIDAVADGLALVDAGHYGTEYIFIDHVKRVMEAEIPQIKVTGAKIAMPFWVV